MKIAVAQISCSLGDLKANLLKIRDSSRLKLCQLRSANRHEFALVKFDPLCPAQ